MSSKTESDLNLDNYKHHYNSPGFVDCFIKNGFVITDGVIDLSLIEENYTFFSKRYLENKAKFTSKFPEKTLPCLGIARHIFSEWTSEGLFEKTIKSDLLLNALEKFLGPDLALGSLASLWVNDPDDPSVVTNKALHQEVWTGSGVDDITIWIPYHNTEPENTMSVIPESHYFGFFPNQNRKIVYPEGFKLPDSIPLAPLKPGCAVFFHALLLHKTSGRGKNIRYASSHLVKNAQTPSTRQQQTYGFTALKSGPMSKISIGLGNDYLSPLRTYGGINSNNQIFNPSDLE